MCNHYRIKNPERVVAFASLKAEAREEPAWQVVTHASPWGQIEMPVVYRAEKTTLGSMRWGFWPWYNRDPLKPGFISNSRNDALFGKIWKKPLETARCLVPADGFYEWKGPKGQKWEVLFHLPDEAPFFFAGLWSRDPVGEKRGFSFVTTEPNELVASLPHDRMPLILGADAADTWLSGVPLSAEDVAKICVPWPSDQLIAVEQPLPQRKSAPKSQPVKPAQDELF